MRLGIFVATSIVMLAACESSKRTVVEAGAPVQDSDLAIVRSWAAEARPAAADLTMPGQSQDLPSVAMMLDGLERRLANSPDDVKGWRLLAASYAHVGRMNDARRAKAKAVDLGADPLEIEKQILAAHAGFGR